MKRKHPRGTIVLADRTPPIKAIHTANGIICSRCGGEAQPKTNFPRQKGIPGSTCKDCLNKAAALKRAEKKSEMFSW